MPHKDPEVARVYAKAYAKAYKRKRTAANIDYDEKRRLTPEYKAYQKAYQIAYRKTKAGRAIILALEDAYRTPEQKAKQGKATTSACYSSG